MNSGAITGGTGCGETSLDGLVDAWSVILTLLGDAPLTPVPVNDRIGVDVIQFPRSHLGN